MNLEDEIVEEEVDHAAVDELYLFAMNDAASYQSRHEPYVANYTRRMKKNLYNSSLGLKGIVNNYVPEIIANYKKENSLAGINKSTKITLGKELLEEILDCVRYRLMALEGKPQ